MNSKTLEQLEFNKVKELVRDQAMSYLGKQHAEQMEPIAQIKMLRIALNDTAEALKILQNGGHAPIPSLSGIDFVVNLLGTGYLFSEQDFSNIHLFLHSSAQLKRYMAAKSDIAPKISQFALSLHELDHLKSEIERCLRNNRITDQASKELAKIRKKLITVEERIKSRIHAILNRNADYLQENLVSMRGSRYVIPVKKEHRKRINGSILDESSSGQTVYIEPAEIAHLQTEWNLLRMEEAREEAKVLSELTGLVEEAQHEIKLNIETIGIYDFLFAKAKYAKMIGGCNVELNDRGVMNISAATHPLLGKEMVPLHFAIGSGYQSLIITGPNTGGKTVALKTIGLLTLMVQSGLLVPVKEGSVFSVFRHVAVDIGDGQSLEQSLSTFSAHIQFLIDLLSFADEATLVLIDEMASGTDPGEGIGLSIAILEELQRRKTTVVATTHFNEIKHFAAVAPGFENARMEFNTDTLQPLYRLKIGEAGQSYAFLIAKKLGISQAIIERSQEITNRRENTEGKTFQYALDEALVSLSVEDDAEAEGKIEAEAEIKRTAPERVEGEGREADVVMSERVEPQADPDHAAAAPVAKPLAIGDRVLVSFLKRTGTVFQLPDNRGNVGVLVQEQKMFINHKRLSLHISHEELYPDNYDMDIVFETKENRKKRKLMNRKHVEGLMIITEPDE